jgi:hypothetical protein
MNNLALLLSHQGKYEQASQDATFIVREPLFMVFIGPAF